MLASIAAAVALQLGGGGGLLGLAVLFFVLAIVAALVGSRGLAGISMEVARILVGVFILLLIISIVLSFI